MCIVTNCPHVLYQTYVVFLSSFHHLEQIIVVVLSGKAPESSWIVYASASQVCNRIYLEINRLFFCSKIMFHFNMVPEQSAAFDLH